MRVAVGNHDVTDVDVAREGDRRRTHPAVGGAAVEAIRLHRHNIKARARPGVVHALQEDEVVQVAPGQRHRTRQRAANNHDLRVNRLERVIGAAQQAGVGFRVHVLVAPFRVDVRLVPHLIVADAPPVAFGYCDGEIDVILHVVGRGFLADVRVGVCPVGRVAQARLDFQPVLPGQINDMVVLGPGVNGVGLPIAVQVVAAVCEVAAPVDFDVLPGELLPYPVKPGVGNHLHLPLALLWLDLLFQKRVDAEWVDIYMLYGRQRGGVGLKPGEVAQPFDHAAHLRQRLFFARQRPERLPCQPAIRQIEREQDTQDADNQNNPNDERCFPNVAHGRGL